MDWNNDFTLQFLKLYRNEPCIWDPTHKYYKRREKVASAWQRLVDMTGKPISELKRKKESLMATFRSHSRKKKASLNGGAEGDEVYQPVWFAFNFMESFLGEVYGINTPDMNQNDHENLDNADLIKQEDCDSPPPVVETYQPILHEPYKRRRSAMDSREDENVQSGAFSLLKSVLARKEEEEDECDLYCKIMAIRLRKLPDMERHMLMHEMDGMVLDVMDRTCYANSSSSKHFSMAQPSQSSGLPSSHHPSNRRNEPHLDIDSKADIHFE